EFRLVASTQMKNTFELTEFRLIASTQMKNTFELTEFRLVDSTQLKSTFELTEFRLILSIQMRFYVNLIIDSFFIVKSIIFETVVFLLLQYIYYFTGLC
ncbi:MAG: hypothetical protein ABS916_03865, partial [Carnobacterium sp.]